MNTALLTGHVTLTPGAPLGQSVHLQRPDLLARLAPGRTGDEMPALLGSVFTLCAAAHRLTASAALAAARGDASPAQHTPVLQLATAREQVLRLSHDWPRWLLQDSPSGHAASLEESSALMLRSCPLWREAWSAPERLAALPDWLEHRWLGMAPAAWLARHTADPEHWPQQWLAQQRQRQPMGNPLVRVLHRVAPLAQRLLTPGQALLPDTSPALSGLAAMEHQVRTLAAAMHATPTFCQRPDCSGTPADSGPWSRLNDPLPLAARTRTAWDRLIARLVDLLRLSQPDGVHWLACGALALGPGEGVAWTEMTRGLLIHHAQLEADGQRVRRWQVLAPTEWNFHPAGALAQALTALGEYPPEQRPAAARVLAAAFDPCVEFSLSLHQTPSPSGAQESSPHA